jgi:hypothetical protein
MAEHEPSIGQSDDWHTPPDIFAKLGGLRFFDPCAPSDRTHYHVPLVHADAFYTKEDDGLVRPWPDLIIFMNPPFGGREGHLPWLQKFFKHANGIAICRAYTSSRWWHSVVIRNAETLLFPRGKTKFIRPDGTIGSAPGHGIALVGMGEVVNAALERQAKTDWFVDLRVIHRRPAAQHDSKRVDRVLAWHGGAAP